MSLYTLPFLYLNLGGEMVYILEQRLRAQNANEQKQRRVMQDIIKRMLSEGVLSTLFTAQPLTTLKRLKANFNKLANTSLVNLSEGSMDKLYDLMLTTFKYQLLMCKSGQELILLTLNHLDGMRDMVKDNHTLLINRACTLFTDCYHSFSEAQLTIARHTLLSLLQNFSRKVTLFLAENWQLPTGDFVLPHGGKVPYGVQPPGMVRYLYGDNNVEMVTLWCNYEGMERKGSLDVMGDRTVSIGNNFYRSKELAKASSKGKGKKGGGERTLSTKESNTTKHTGEDHSAKAELDFLQHLLIGFQQPPSESDFKLNLFDDPPSGNADTSTSDLSLVGAVKVAKTDSKGHVSSVMKDFDKIVNTSEKTSHQDEGEDDLLALMDNL